MGFKSHIKKILCYPFKLKYLNQKVFYPILKKHNFFSWEHRVYIPMGFKSHIWKKKKRVLTGSRPGRPGHGLTRWVDRVWLDHCTDRYFDKPGPVQPPGRPGPGSTRRAGSSLITMLRTIVLKPRPARRVDPGLRPV